MLGVINGGFMNVVRVYVGMRVISLWMNSDCILMALTSSLTMVDIISYIFLDMTVIILILIQ